jgi:hypothetical protein
VENDAEGDAGGKKPRPADPTVQFTELEAPAQGAGAPLAKVD